MEKTCSSLRVKNHLSYCYLCILLFCTSCSPGAEKFIEAEIFELHEYETIVSNENYNLAEPTVLSVIGESKMLVYDHALGYVTEFDFGGNKEREIGREGQGPGEFFLLNNIIAHSDKLYFIDFGQALIHKYSRDGEHSSSLDYGALGYITSPAPPMGTGSVMARELTHQPHLTFRGNVLLSPALASELPDKIFHKVTWEGEKQFGLGRIPEGSTLELNPEENRTAISNNETPPNDKANVFAVNDLKNTDEFFFVYSAIPRIDKYDYDGELLWTVDIPGVPELEDYRKRHSELVETLTPASWISFNKYMTGVSSPDGDLFLATNTNPELPGPLWIHRFDSEGNMAARYTIKSDVNTPPIFDIDFENNRFLVVTEEAEIRAYRFDP